MPALAADCPTAPADYTGSDQVVDELRDLRIEQADACAALAQRLGTLPDIKAAVEAGRDRIGDVSSPSSGTTNALLRGLPTTTAEATDVAPVVSSVEESSEAVRAALWFLGGLLLVVVLVPFLARTFTA